MAKAIVTQIRQSDAARLNRIDPKFWVEYNERAAAVEKLAERPREVLLNFANTKIPINDRAKAAWRVVRRSEFASNVINLSRGYTNQDIALFILLAVDVDEIVAEAVKLRAQATETDALAGEVRSFLQ